MSMMVPADILSDIGFEMDSGKFFGVCRDDHNVFAFEHLNGVICLDTIKVQSYAHNKSTMVQVDDIRRAEYVAAFAGNSTGNLSLLDFGAGDGGFAEEYRRLMPNDHVDSYEPAHGGSAESLAFDYDIVTLFHVLEHLADPVSVLRDLHGRMRHGAKLIVEVPHARDWLLHHCEAFRNFSLWSEHKILHTRESLSCVLEAGGFAVEHVSGVQRYGIDNHRAWLEYGRPHVHCNPMPASQADNAYREIKTMANESDTLVAVGHAGISSNWGLSVPSCG